MRRPLPLILLLAACGTAAPDDVPVERTERGTFQVQVAIDGSSLRRGRNTLTARAWDDAGRVARLRSVTARMPSHNHTDVTAAVVWDGTTARVDDLTLTMPGRWEITLRFEEGARDDAAVWWVWLP
jgi:hypothetical protein